MAVDARSTSSNRGGSVEMSPTCLRCFVTSENKTPSASMVLTICAFELRFMQDAVSCRLWTSLRDHDHESSKPAWYHASWRNGRSRRVGSDKLNSTFPPSFRPCLDNRSFPSMQAHLQSILAFCSHHGVTGATHCSSLVESIAKSPTVLFCYCAITNLRLQHERNHGLQKCGLAQ